MEAEGGPSGEGRGKLEIPVFSDCETNDFPDQQENPDATNTSNGGGDAWGEGGGELIWSLLNDLRNQSNEVYDLVFSINNQLGGTGNQTVLSTEQWRYLILQIDEAHDINNALADNTISPVAVQFYLETKLTLDPCNGIYGFDFDLLKSNVKLSYFCTITLWLKIQRMDSLFLLMLLSSNPYVEQFLTYHNVDSFYTSIPIITNDIKYEPNQMVSWETAQITYDEAQYNGQLIFTQSTEGDAGMIFFFSKDNQFYDNLKIELTRRARDITLNSYRTNVFIPKGDESIRYSFGGKIPQGGGLTYRNSATLSYNPETGAREVQIFIRWDKD